MKGLIAAVAWLGLAGVSQAQVMQEVVFRVGDNASIDWFVINNPTIHGTLNVANAPYPSTDGLNAAAVDVNRNRLVFNDPANGYAISLAGLQLIAGGGTPVTVSSLGTYPDLSYSAGYRKTDGQLYYIPDQTIQLKQLNFNPTTGTITGATVFGNFTGGPTAIHGGDLDFAANGSIWVTGDNQNGQPRLWNFDGTTLNALSVIVTPNFYNGITFNAAGDTLFGYQATTGQYGVIDTTTGVFQTVLDTDTTFFGVNGDLATGTAIVVSGIPEPSTLGLGTAAAIGGAVLACRRRYRLNRMLCSQA
jgi:hypothetical protein